MSREKKGFVFQRTAKPERSIRCVILCGLTTEAKCRCISTCDEYGHWASQIRNHYGDIFRATHSSKNLQSMRVNLQRK